MTPSARVQAAIDILAALEGTAQPADRYLREWFRARRYAGSKDRASVAERVYDVFRHRASFAWRMGRDDARSMVIASVLAEGKTPEDIDALFDGQGYGAKPLTDDERGALGTAPAGEPPSYVQGDFPEWLEPELRRAFGEALIDEMRAMLARAPVDLRVNTLRATREDMLTGLQALNVKAEPMRYSPWGIRIESAEGLSALQHTQFFQTGAFEFQDEASQIAALLCAAKPGDQVLDLAAGAGGKSLALVAAMQDKGMLVAFDDIPGRMKEIGPRARRAGATIVSVAEKRNGPLWGKGSFDVVLVDSPCSGSGTWRRTPELKWRLTAERLKALIKLQKGLIDDAARQTKPGGRLVYATCSLLPCENEDVIDAFLARNAEFHRLNAADVWREAGLPPVPGMDQDFHASPRTTGTDGFFVSVLART